MQKQVFLQYGPEAALLNLHFIRANRQGLNAVSFPSLLVLVSNFWFVSVLVASTRTSGTNAFEGSWTNPVRLALLPWANTRLENNNMKSVKTARRRIEMSFSSEVVSG